MRSEQEMRALILGFAEADNRIRAVYMNGSRANPAAPRDEWQDFDIVYVCQTVLPFVYDKSWIPFFGEIAVMQEPDATALFDDLFRPGDRYAYLMQFADGNRIDLTFMTLAEAEKQYASDSLTVPLLDKDGRLPPLPPPSDKDYHVKKPTMKQYWDCCNEFWWVVPYAVKGLRRGETLYALDHLNLNIRPMLLQMLEWQAGVLTDFSVSTGKCGKYLRRYLPNPVWSRLLATYPKADSEDMRRALLEMCALFDETARTVGAALGYPYREDEARGSVGLIRRWLADPPR